MDKNTEWNYIAKEIIYNKPKRAPYKGRDLLKRVLLFSLRDILTNYCRAVSQKKRKILEIKYNIGKEYYIHFERIL